MPQQLEDFVFLPKSPSSWSRGGAMGRGIMNCSCMGRHCSGREQIITVVMNCMNHLEGVILCHMLCVSTWRTCHIH